MKAIIRDHFAQLLQQAHVKPRLRRELRFGASIADISSEDWADMELINISVRSGNEGVLLMELEDQLFVLPYELSGRLADPKTGRSKPIICDLCTTWQAGDNASTITFHNVKAGHKVTFLCCADLKCSLHVRSRTDRARQSRAQLREDLTNEQRVERLRVRLLKLVGSLGLESVSAS